MTVLDLALNIYKVCVCKSDIATHIMLKFDAEQFPVCGGERNVGVFVVTKV